ncbi:MAG TPA: alpha/beta hydrolase [Thermomicrobiales bacterium]|nr:alpha/beta hydrolase [Thermomicrobiales bacterium]
MTDTRDDRFPATRRDLVKLALGASAGAGLAAPAALVRAQAAATPVAASAPTAAANQTVRVGDIDIAYRILGQGEPLLMVMGSQATMDLWDPTLLDRLASRYLVVLFDNRGIGGTTGTGPYPFTQLADDTVGLIQALGLGQPNVLGWSMGGSVALDLALRHPSAVRKAVLYGASAGGSNAVPPSPAVIAVLSDQSGTPQQRGERLLEILFPAEWARSHQAYIMRVFANAAPPATTAAAAGFQIQAIAQWSGVADRLAQAQPPTMIVHGMDDVITPPQNAQILADGIPGSWLIRLAGAGHGAMYQEPKRFAALVDAFFAG